MVFLLFSGIPFSNVLVCFSFQTVNFRSGTDNAGAYNGFLVCAGLFFKKDDKIVSSHNSGWAGSVYFLEEKCYLAWIGFHRKYLCVIYSGVLPIQSGISGNRRRVRFCCAGNGRCGCDCSAMDRLWNPET